MPSVLARLAVFVMAPLLGWVRVDATEVVASTELTDDHWLAQKQTQQVIFQANRSAFEVRRSLGRMQASAGMSYAYLQPQIFLRDSKVDLSLNSTVETWHLFCNIAPFTFGSVRADVSVQPDRPCSYSFQARAIPLDRLHLFVLAGKRDYLPLTADLRYDGEGGPTELWLVGRELSFGLKWMISSEWEIESSQTHTTFDSNTVHSSEYMLNPGGMFRCERVKLTRRSSSLNLSSTYQKFSYDGRLMGYSDGHRFAHFGIASGDLEAISMRVASRRTALELLRFRGKGEAMGSVEAWPFLDGLARFIGERRHLIAKAELSGYRGTGSVRTTFGRRLTAKWECEFFHLRPKADYRTWRPIAFGLGVDDYKSGQLEVEKAQLLRVRITPELRIGSIFLRANLAQWIPLKIAKNSDSSKSTSEGGGANSPSNPESSTGWSGLTASLGIRTAF